MAINDVFNPKPIPQSAYSNGTLWNYTLGVYEPTIMVQSASGWVTLPVSKEGSSFIVTTFVTEGRSAQGVVVGEQIGRQQMKFNGLTYPFLYLHEWERLIDLLQVGVKTYFKFYDIIQHKEVIRALYPGDRTATIYAYAPYVLSGESTARPQILSNCTVNLIDRGEQ